MAVGGEGSGILPLGPGPLPLKPGLSSSRLLTLATAPVLVNSLLSNLLPPGCVSLGQAPISHLGAFGPGGQGHPADGRPQIVLGSKVPWAAMLLPTHPGTHSAGRGLHRPPDACVACAPRLGG